MIILISASLSSKYTTKLPYEKNSRLRKENQHCLDHQSFHEFSFALEMCAGLAVLDYSDTCIREELRRSDPVNQARVYRPTSTRNFHSLRHRNKYVNQIIVL